MLETCRQLVLLSAATELAKGGDGRLDIDAIQRLAHSARALFGAADLAQIDREASELNARRPQLGGLHSTQVEGAQGAAACLNVQPAL